MNRTTEERLHALEVSNSINLRGNWWSVDVKDDRSVRTIVLSLHPVPWFGFSFEISPHGACELIQALRNAVDEVTSDPA